MTRDGIAITIIAVGVFAAFAGSIVWDSLPHTRTVPPESYVAGSQFLFPRGLPRSARILNCKARYSPVGDNDKPELIEGCSISIDAQDFPSLVKDFVHHPESEVHKPFDLLRLAEMPRIVDVYYSSHWELSGCFIYSDASKTRLAVFRKSRVIVN